MVISISSTTFELVIDSLNTTNNITHLFHVDSDNSDSDTSKIVDSHDEGQCNIHHCHSNQNLTTTNFLISTDFKSILFILDNLNIYISPLYSFFRPPISF